MSLDDITEQSTPPIVTLTLQTVNKLLAGHIIATERLARIGGIIYLATSRLDPVIVRVVPPAVPPLRGDILSRLAVKLAV